MKNPVYVRLLAFALVAFSLQSCKKEDKEDAQLNQEFKQFNDDSNVYKEESDQVDSDVDKTVSDIPALSGRIANVHSDPLCGAALDTSQLSQKIVYINFDGVTPCFSPSRTRQGQIKVQLTSGNYWSDINAVLTITYINFKVTRLSDNKSIQLNGVKTLKNMNGNNWLGFLAGTAILRYQSRAFNINVLYDNGATAVWNVTRMVEWSNTSPSPNGGIRFSFECNGDSTLNGFSTVDSWGTNRYGQPFTTYYTQPWESDTYCGLWRPNDGQLIHNVNSSNFTITLGVNQSGSPSTLDCAYGFKVDWTVNGNTQSAVYSY